MEFYRPMSGAKCREQVEIFIPIDVKKFGTDNLKSPELYGPMAAASGEGGGFVACGEVVVIGDRVLRVAFMKVDFGVGII